MKKIPLLPGYFKWIGMALTVLSLALYFYTDILLTLILITSLAGLTFVAFARKKIEDEMMKSLKLARVLEKPVETLFELDEND